jgi:hypothetical protein
VKTPLILATALFFAATTANAGTLVEQQRVFGTMTGTACTGPLSPTTTDGVQIFGFTNATRKLTWQVFSVAEDDSTAMVFSTSARFVDEVVPPEDGMVYYVCVVRTGATAQDYDLVINSQRLE